MKKLLEVEHLNIRFEVDDGTVYAVNDLSFDLEAGKALGIVGETGAGKTTTALSLLRLVPDPPGVVECEKMLLEGQDVLKLSIKELENVRGKDISMIFQDPMTALNPVFTVGDQIAESIQLHENLSPPEVQRRTLDMLELVGIPAERSTEYPHQFSGGMKQRVVIAIALACRPKLLIADEPTTALDVTIQAQVLELMKNLRTKYQTSLIMITHDLGIVAEICDEVAVMYAGNIVEKGTLEDIFNRTKHPYTEGLFNSLPNINDRKGMLTPIRGLMPDPTNLPIGCPFHPRCPYMDEKCLQPQKETWITPTHSIRCVAYERPGFHIERKERVQ